MKKLIVTGAANGIGRATVELAIQQGYFVIGADKDAEGLNVLQGLYDADVFEAHSADFSDMAVIKGLSQRFMSGMQVLTAWSITPVFITAKVSMPTPMSR